ncbi:YSIRK-type signal peptide-containing protein [Staphylococcus capitis]|uniref:YSIRK-type signal peptide-containing protein n=1 Tax=Staphylococcus capitis TaxID=29388 RepID=UPI002878F7B4|nr:YSIRK-type signal peptide-containing protein [Staphylococcus capitis]MDS3979906.1 YSIRK-type signal peptide-containing protein [Staphylococcus capitis]
MFSNGKPTQKNHYSIRIFTVGTASIIVGSFLFFGQAHAEEGTNGNTWQREAVGTVGPTGQPSTTGQDQNNQAGTPAAT